MVLSVKSLKSTLLRNEAVGDEEAGMTEDRCRMLIARGL